MDYQKKVALAWPVVNYNENSEFPEYFAECFSLLICRLHSGKKPELRRPGDVCCVVSTVIQSHTPGTEASPPPALFWESDVVSKAFGNWNCLEVNEGTEKLGCRVNYRVNDSGLASLSWLVQFPSIADP